MSTRCGGVTRRQSARMPARKLKPRPSTVPQTSSRSPELRSSAGNGTSSSVRSAVLLSVHTSEPRQLVDGQVAQRALVAVVQAGELRRDDPDRRGEDEQQRGRGAASPEPDEDRRRRDREHVCHGEHPPQERLRRRTAPRSRSAARLSRELPVRAPGTMSSSLNPAASTAAGAGHARIGRRQRSFGSRRSPLTSLPAKAGNSD